MFIVRFHKGFGDEWRDYWWKEHTVQYLDVQNLELQFCGGHQLDVHPVLVRVHAVDFDGAEAPVEKGCADHEYDSCQFKVDKRAFAQLEVRVGRTDWQTACGRFWMGKKRKKFLLNSSTVIATVRGSLWNYWHPNGVLHTGRNK